MKTEMNYDESISYIRKVSSLGSRPGLSRITELCALLGNPQNSLKFIHVAGTNGKGSTCAMLDSVLRASGYKVGLFTSPYLLDFEERIVIDGRPISKGELSKAVSHVRQLAEKMNDCPTEFELITAVAMHYYSEQNVDLVILEAGMGGRFDATNVISSSVVSVITGIALDHTAILGNTEEKIAWEKAGIAKPGCPLVVGECSPEAENVIYEVAKSAGADIRKVDYGKIYDVIYTVSGTSFTYKSENYTLSLLGKYQIKNTETVLTVLDILGNRGYRITADKVKEGLRHTEWRARFELMSREPIFIYDGGHNPQGVTAAADNIRLLLNKKPILVMGMMADKDFRKSVGILSEFVSSVHTVTPDNPRSLCAEKLSAEFEAFGLSATPHISVEDGVRDALREASKKSLPVVALGSLYMYGDVYRAVKSAGLRR